VRRDAQKFAGSHHDFAIVDVELNRAGVNLRNLFVHMAVERNNATFFKHDARDHDLIPNNQLAIEERVQGLDRNIFPTNVSDLGCCGRKGFRMAHARYLIEPLLEHPATPRSDSGSEQLRSLVRFDGVSRTEARDAKLFMDGIQDIVCVFL
jgi:hypothetical protein